MPTAAFDAIVITTRHARHARAYLSELEDRQRSGKIDSGTLICAAPDPSRNTNIGSGGATLNALVAVTERLSALAGDTFINGARLQGQNRSLETTL